MLVVGASSSGASTTTSMLWAVSSLPATSVERYSTVCVPGSPMVKGAVYAVQSPASIRYSVDSTPDPPVSSVAVSVTCTPSSTTAWVAVVTGAVSSTGGSTSLSMWT